MTRVVGLVMASLLYAAPAWADASCALLTNGSSEVDAASFATASVTVTLNRLALLYVSSLAPTAEVPNTPTVTSTGATWVAVDSQAHPNTRRKLFVFRTLVGSSQTSAITIDYGAQSQLHAIWAIVECSAVDTTGTNGSGAVVTTNKGSAGASTTLTLTFAAYSGDGNRPVVGFATNRTVVGGTLEATWTTLSDEAIAEGMTLTSGWKDATDDTTAVFTSATVDHAGIGVEVKAAVSAAVCGPPFCGSLRK